MSRKTQTSRYCWLRRRLWHDHREQAQSPSQRLTRPCSRWCRVLIDESKRDALLRSELVRRSSFRRLTWRFHRREGEVLRSRLSSLCSAPLFRSAACSSTSTTKLKTDIQFGQRLVGHRELKNVDRVRRECTRPDVRRKQTNLSGRWIRELILPFQRLRGSPLSCRAMPKRHQFRQSLVTRLTTIAGSGTNIIQIFWL